MFGPKTSWLKRQNFKACRNGFCVMKMLIELLRVRDENVFDFAFSQGYVFKSK
jgi:hypothetical protein